MKFTAIILYFCLLLGATSSDHSHGLLKSAAPYIALIEGTPSAADKVEILQNMADEILSRRVSADDADITFLITLLSNEYESVRMWAAAVLGEIGTKAQRAEPQVQALYKSTRVKECKFYGSATGGIRNSDIYLVALKRINEEFNAEVECQ